ncbi:thioredoxin family protein [Arcticibacterium luteifluviistationis]|uniref:Thioredoxin family protein n=1 Tax=Arcticibacterium luteifluviistationis TaxID=1784714 RepID=A0A2Z4G7L5_9BACT|nr:thioredoxin family protein [Arcticibacterium luteifluviistationis]AWV97159.1 thioredoxin family protein [Arcticibacterium luteifluviistationis]
MRKNKATLIAILLLSSFLITSNAKAQERQGPPPNGERRGPPSGAGHSPIQSKTLEEAGGYKIGEVASDFELKNVDGTLFSLTDIENAEGYIITFTCNECPFAKVYEDRLIALHNEYSPKGYSVVAINPNASPDNTRENLEAMKQRAKEKDFPFVYLADEEHTVFPKYGAVRTPHIFLLDKDLKVQYIGTIDDNARHPEDVKVKYVENAIQALQNNEKPEPNFTKAIGCPIKPI